MRKFQWNLFTFFGTVIILSAVGYLLIIIFHSGYIYQESINRQAEARNLEIDKIRNTSAFEYQGAGIYRWTMKLKDGRPIPGKTTQFDEDIVKFVLEHQDLRIVNTEVIQTWLENGPPKVVLVFTEKKETEKGGQNARVRD